MPTLHLIDADSTQACPAVFSTIRAALACTGQPDDRLLLLGGRPLRDAASDAGIDATHQIAVPFGKAVLGLPALRRWARSQTAFDLIHCWSPGALHAASIVFGQAPIQLSLAHTPNRSQTKRLARITRSKKQGRVRILTDTEALARRLKTDNVNCETAPLPRTHDAVQPMSASKRRSLRNHWGVRGDHGRVVALLSDDPRMVDAIDAALVAVMGCATLIGRDDGPLTIHLLMHPMQHNRRRAEELLACQPVKIRMVQDARVAEPWAVLGGCDTALAPGPDAGGLSLRWAVELGLPVIAPCTADDLDDGHANLRRSPSAMHKDLAHLLHDALGDAVV
jgi:hypothetical protein